MSDSTFNPEQFVGQQTDGAGSTKYFPVPVGEYSAVITKVGATRGTSRDSGDEWTRLDVKWEVLDDTARTATEQEHPLVDQSLFLHLTPEGGLDWGRNKNVQLMRLREAVGQGAGRGQWAPNMLTGKMAKVFVEHRPDQNGDPRAQVSRVAPL